MFLLYPLVGLLSGVLAGLLGIGGGLIIVPALLLILPLHGVSAAISMHVAVATSLATVILTALAASYSHHRRGAVQWPIVSRMAAGLALGAASGAWLADAMPVTLLRHCYGVFVLLVAAQMIMRSPVAKTRGMLGRTALAGAGLLIGHLSAIVGIGGGTLTVPLLRWRGLPLAQAVATSSACGLPIALGGSLGFVLLDNDVSAYTAGYIHWPAALGIGLASVLAVPWGVRLAHGVSSLALIRIFSIFLVIVGVHLLLD